MMVPHVTAGYPVRHVSCVVVPPDSLAREDVAKNSVLTVGSCVLEGCSSRGFISAAHGLVTMMQAQKLDDGGMSVPCTVCRLSLPWWKAGTLAAWRGHGVNACQRVVDLCATKVR